MAQPVIQTSFNSGEWSPALNARVDIAKYHSGAAALRNFFVDYRGGATTRPGTKYICTCGSTDTVRLIPFQASFTVTYILEFGDGYLRFVSNGAQIVTAPNTPYQIASPYAANELAALKFTQNISTLIICHPNHPPYVLTLIAATNWTLAQITFGATISAPTGQAVATTLAAGTVNYAYVITAVDSSGQESVPSAFATLANVTDLRTVAGTNTVTWSAVTGATSYNVYKTEPRYGGVVPAGVSFGFIGNVLGLTLIDSNIAPDYSSGPPVSLLTTSGGSVISVTMTNNGNYTTVPNVTFAAGTITATGTAVLQTILLTIASDGAFYNVGDTATFSNGLVVQVTGITGAGVVTSITQISPGTVYSGATPANVLHQLSTSGSGVDLRITALWGVTSVTLTNAGSGYAVAPAITFSSGAAAATCTVSPIATPISGSGFGNPAVPALFQQRLVLANYTTNPQLFQMSQTGIYYNFNVHNPIESSDSISGSLVSGQLNSIQAMLPQPQGLIILSDKQAWLVNGGSAGSAVAPDSIVANAQAYNGASYVPPIVANDHILYVQSKGSIVRDLAFNFYTQVYTGADITVLSSHLFYNYNVTEWAWAEEPYKIVWAVRNDGTLLSLTYLKEQELIAWAHSDTAGTFQSIATVTEQISQNYIDAVYVVVHRTINGSQVKYIERLAEIGQNHQVVDSWCVDAGLRYSGAPATVFSGAAHLAGQTVTGLADGIVIPPFTMDVSGVFTLGTAASNVLIGIPFTAQLQTLALDIGEPTIQGKRKKITGVTVRVKDTLGLSIGGDFHHLVAMKDLVRGNVGSATNTIVTDLVTADARTIINPNWTVPGQYCLQQTQPLPASILGVIPEITVGDTK